MNTTPHPRRKTQSSGSDRQSIAAAYTLMGAVLGLGLLGYLLDRKFQTGPYLLLGGLLLGLVIGFYDLWKAMFPPGDRK